MPRELAVDTDEATYGRLFPYYAELCALSVSQLKRHLRRLKKLHLVHVATDLGSSNRTWLLFHPLFAFCQPLPQVTSDLPPSSEVTYGVGQNRATQRRVQRKDAERGSATFAEATSYSGVPAVRGEQKVNGEDHGEDSPEGPITDSPFTPRVNVQRTPGWYSLSDVEKRNRFEQIDRLSRELEYFAEHLENPDKNIRRQARHEVERRLGQLIARGAVERPVKWKGEP